MRQETKKAAEELEPLQRRLEEIRRSRSKRGALPEEVWEEAAQAARQHGVNMTAKVLGLAYSGLKMRRKDAPIREKGKS